MRSVLLISMKRNEIVIKISEDAEYDKILEMIDKKLPVLKKLYKEARNPIRVTGKFLKEREMEEIRDIVKKEINVDISFDNVNELGLAGIKKVYEQNVDNSETFFFKGGLRSGQRIEYEGSVAILGDVNSGAEVIAGDNIVVLGVLRGLAHAGGKGNRKAIIACNRIECPQLRIADELKEIEKEEITECKQFAYIKDDKIVIE